MLTLKEWRRARGISIKDYADYLGVSTSTVNNWENHNQKMPIDKALAACKYFGVKLDDVIFQEQKSNIV